jgi:hypothetical protein
LTTDIDVLSKDQVFESDPESSEGDSEEEIDSDDGAVPQLPNAEREIEGDFE